MLVRLEHISKAFVRRSVLSDVNLSFFEGEIHALLGENGAGKSTLVHILSGLLPPTEGAIVCENKTVRFKSPQDAIAEGILMVHQRPLLADSLTVWENTVIGCEPVKAGDILKIKQVHTELRNLIKEWNIDIDIDARVSSLTSSGRLYAAFLAALWRSPRLLILDEPSAALAPEQREAFFSHIQKAAAQGLSVVFITHNLEEALNLSDRIAVLREGKLVADLDNSKKELGANELCPLMFGRKNTNISADEPSSPAQAEHTETSSARPVLSVQSLTVSPPGSVSIYDITFPVYSGELTVIAGKRESGLETLENVLSGMYEASSGGHKYISGIIQIGNSSFYLGKKARQQMFTIPDTRTLRHLKIGIVPSDRTFRGSDPSLSLFDILIIHRQRIMKKGPFLDKKTLKEFTVSLIRQEAVAAVPEQKASSLSGGMLQRLILARELAEKPRFLLLAEPAWGLDMQSAEQMWKRLRTTAAEGTAVLVLSADTDTFYNRFSDRVYYMKSGSLVPSYSGTPHNAGMQNNTVESTDNDPKGKACEPV